MQTPVFERYTSGKLAKYTSFGCYPLFYLTADNSCLCADCANAESLADLVACDANWEDPNLTCDGCSERIESAYAEDEQEACQL